MARRRKKTARNAAQRQKSAANTALLDKSLPSLPPSAAPKSTLSPELETPPSETHSETPTEIPPRLRPRDERHDGPRGGSRERRDISSANGRSNSRGLFKSLLTRVSSSTDHLADALNILQIQDNSPHSSISQRSEAEGAGGEEFLIPVGFDPTPPAQSSPLLHHYNAQRPEPRDYFGPAKTAEHVARKLSGDTPPSPHVSPHIAYQEKGRVHSEEVIGSIKKRREGSFSAIGPVTTSLIVGTGANRHQHATSPEIAQGTGSIASEERFKLQEVPKARRSEDSARSSYSRPNSSTGALPAVLGQNHGLERTDNILGGNASATQEPESSSVTQKTPSSSSSQDYRSKEDWSLDASTLAQPSATGQSHYPPKRVDSLETSKPSPSIPRKEVASAPSKSQESPRTSQGVSSASSAPTMASDHVNAAEQVNGAKVVSRPVASLRSKGVSDTSTFRKEDVLAPDMNGSFVVQRAPSSPQNERAQTRNEPFSTSQAQTSKPGESPTSPSLPRWSSGGAFSMDEDLARILGEEHSPGHESFLRRVSHNVHHGRSFSDKGTRSSREHKWSQSSITNSAMVGQDISSASTASPEHGDELAWVKDELSRERQKTVERERRIVELESALHSTASIKQVNVELREKRSTIVVLETQKEMVMRELEVLNEHVTAAKKTGDPLDLSKMNHTVIRDFAESLQKLKDSFAPQIEESVQKRNALVDELSNLTQMKDKGFQEFNQLSLKNAQLAELNNQLVHQIQDLYKATSGAQVEHSRGAPDGLGIYPHHNERSQMAADSHEARSNINEMSVLSSGTTLQQEEAEPVTVLQGPHVVNIRKGQPKKFNWKKGGQHVAKGVTKGLKGAFSSTQASYSREMQFTESLPYNSTPPTSDHSNNNMRHGNSDLSRPGFGLFGGNPKLGTKGHQPWKLQSNGSSPPAIDAATSRSPIENLVHMLLMHVALFGSDLEARAEFERAPIPFIVTRCAEEVELRGKDSEPSQDTFILKITGMDVEGIYRKAGGASQVQVIKDGFETSPQQNFDISDPDLDIHAVSSTLKQYFRRLPNPLVTYEVYDKLLETTSIPSFDAKVEAMSQALMDLPKVHREVLEFLVFHLNKVVSHERDNLMTSMNVAVVFAPTIMRPESVAREMTDTQVKNEAVQFLVENCQLIFDGVRA